MEKLVDVSVLVLGVVGANPYGDYGDRKDESMRGKLRPIALIEYRTCLGE
jgi:hypothetical protein